MWPFLCFKELITEPSTLHTCMTQNYMTFWSTLGPFKYPQSPKKALLGALGPPRAMEVLGIPKGG